MILYGFGVIFTTGVIDYKASLREEGLGLLPETHKLWVFWGTVPRSMFTLLKCLTGGISWHDVVLPLSDAGWAYVAIFIFFMVFTVFAGHERHHRCFLPERNRERAKR